MALYVRYSILAGGASGGGGGTVTANQGTPNTTANGWPVKITDGTNTASVSAANRLLVDASGTTQPVSGTVTVVQPTGANLHAVIDSGTVVVTQAVGTNLHTVVDASALPTGAATETTLAAMSAKLPASLGPKTVAGSLSIAPATDAMFSINSADSVTTGNITAADAIVPAPSGNGALLSGASTAGSLVAVTCPGGDSAWIIQLTGTISGTYYFEESVDSTNGTNGNWTNVNGRQTGVVNTVLAGGVTTAGFYRGNTSGSTWVRVRNVGGSGLATAVIVRISSGTGAVFLNASIPAGSNNIGSVSIASSAGSLIANAPIQNDYSGSPVTTAAYTTLVASTSNAINNIHIFDSSGQAMILAIGAAAAEVNQLYVPPGGDTYTLSIPAGTRISYKALTANATSGYVVMSFLR
jgi:hypothetical protein